MVYKTNIKDLWLWEWKTSRTADLLYLVPNFLQRCITVVSKFLKVAFIHFSSSAFIVYGFILFSRKGQPEHGNFYAKSKFRGKQQISVNLVISHWPEVTHSLAHGANGTVKRCLDIISKSAYHGNRLQMITLLQTFINALWCTLVTNHIYSPN